MRARRPRGLSRLGSLSVRLALTYFLVVFLALAAVDVLVLGSIETFTLRQREVAAFASTNIAVNQVEPYYRSGQPTPSRVNPLIQVVRDYSRQSGSRVLALDTTGLVVADSNWPAGYQGRVMTQPEVTQALDGRTVSGRRYLEGTGWVLYTVAPVLENKQPVGAVFLSSSLNDVYAGLSDVARTMLVMSAVALLLATLAGLAVGRTITGPVARLTRAVEKMGRGDLHQRVRVRGRDEVALLSRTFNDMAERLAEEDARRREFLADVAHELQTPVAAIRALAEPMSQAGADHRPVEPAPDARPAATDAQAQAAGTDVETYRELGREMESQAERLGRLVGDLLDLARLDSPKVSLALEQVDLAGLVGGVVHSFRPRAQTAGVNLAIGALEAVTAIGDGLRLEQVFANLVSNGIKYAGTGSTVTVEVCADEGDAVVTVADNGPGVSPEHLGHLFERFYRVDRSRSRRGGGTGLGLAIAKRIIELHGGTVSARGREGGGIVFEVRLPLAN